MLKISRIDSVPHFISPKMDKVATTIILIYGNSNYDDSIVTPAMVYFHLCDTVLNI